MKSNKISQECIKVQSNTYKVFLQPRDNLVSLNVILQELLGVTILDEDKGCLLLFQTKVLSFQQIEC